MKQQISRDAKGFDLVVSAKGSPLQSILSSIYHIDIPTGNIPLSEANALRQNPKIKMAIPLRLVGQAPGVAKGGTLVRKRATLSVIAFPKDMPDHIDVDCSTLDFHHAVKVSDVKVGILVFADPPQASIAVVEVPRAAKMAAEDAAKAAETAAATPTVEGAPAVAGAPGAPGAPGTPAAPAAGDAKKPDAPKKDDGKKK